MTYRLLSVLAGLAIAASGTAVALAHNGTGARAARAKAKVFVATLKPVQADVRDYADMTAKARLSARGRRATIRLTARGLRPKRTYRWAITTRTCRGSRLAGWTFKRFKTNSKGRGHSTAASRRFKARSTTRRFVVIYQRGTTEPLLCGRLKRKRSR